MELSEEEEEEDEELYDISEEGAEVEMADKMFNYGKLDPKLREINPNEIGFKTKFEMAKPELGKETGGYADEKRKKDKENEE